MSSPSDISPMWRNRLWLNLCTDCVTSGRTFLPVFTSPRATLLVSGLAPPFWSRRHPTFFAVGICDEFTITIPLNWFFWILSFFGVFAARVPRARLSCNSKLDKSNVYTISRHERTHKTAHTFMSFFHIRASLLKAHHVGPQQSIFPAQLAVTGAGAE
jgi:hypothetical protein